MAKGYGLRGLQVSEAGHNSVAVAAGQVDGALLQSRQLGGNGIDRGAQVQADISGHLVVARAPGMQLLAGDPDQLRQPGLDVHVDIFQFHRPGEAAAGYFFLHLGQAALDICQLFLGKHARRAQHFGVGERAGDVLGGHAAVEIDRRGKALHKTVGGLAETPAPQFAGILLVTHSVWFPAVDKGRRHGLRRRLLLR